MYIYIYVRVCVCVSCLSLSMCVCAHVTLQEYNIEKMQLVEAEKGRIRKEYERKEGQVEVLKKMYVFSLSTTSCVCVCVCVCEERKGSGNIREMYIITMAHEAKIKDA